MMENTRHWLGACAVLLLLLAGCSAGGSERVRSRVYDHVASLLTRYCQGAEGSFLRDAALAQINTELKAREAPRVLGLDCTPVSSHPAE